MHHRQTSSSGVSIAPLERASPLADCPPRLPDGKHNDDDDNAGTEGRQRGDGDSSRLMTSRRWRSSVPVRHPAPSHPDRLAPRQVPAGRDHAELVVAIRGLGAERRSSGHGRLGDEGSDARPGPRRQAVTNPGEGTSDSARTGQRGEETHSGALELAPGIGSVGCGHHIAAWRQIDSTDQVAIAANAPKPPETPRGTFVRVAMTKTAAPMTAKATNE